MLDQVRHYEVGLFDCRANILALTSSFALNGSGRGFHYIGIGGSYAIEEFDHDDIEEFIESVDIDFDNTWGVSLKYGDRFTEYFLPEGVVNYLFHAAPIPISA